MKNELVFHKVALKSKELGCNLLDGIMPEMIRGRRFYNSRR